MDSGILGAWISPDNLTVTVSVGHSLFDERYGLADKAPKKLQKMTRFPNDSLDAALCHGDLLLQICANTQDTVIHALRDVIKHTPDLLSVRWKREGFISDSAARSKGKETPVNLLGFKDGTANPVSTDKALMDEVVWVTSDQGEPAWATGGSYQAARIIQFHVEFWDRTPLKEQQTILGAISTAARRWVCSMSMTCRITVGILMAILSRWIATFVWRTRAHRRRSPV
jgi:deferrochelatase/peroxidase EfeB